MTEVSGRLAFCRTKGVWRKKVKIGGRMLDEWNICGIFAKNLAETEV